MGRTNPTFRNYLEDFKGQWSEFRKALRKEDQEALDRIFVKADSHAHAASYMNSSNPVLPILFSILIEQEKEIQELCQQVE
ncbi:MAG: hypothetical protein ABEJ99_03270 [Candidatus Nanohaloarchaea archaeon]